MNSRQEWWTEFRRELDKRHVKTMTDRQWALALSLVQEKPRRFPWRAAALVAARSDSGDQAARPRI